MLVSDFDYPLPPELIAQEPLADRASSRLLHLKRGEAAFRDDCFRSFPELLLPDDLLVFNDTRVFPARLYGRRSGSHAQPVSPNNRAAHDFLQGQVEVLLTRQISTDSNEWECLVRPGRKIGIGEILYFGDKGQPHLEAEVISRGSFGERIIRFAPVPDFFACVEKLGHVPLPPYIDRKDLADDRTRYQTVFARETGSAAAPTAGLHFTPEILDRIRARGIETASITLHVGLGTFQPVREAKVEDNHLHVENYSISASAAEAINAALRDRRRVVAVGTTTVRTLEYAARRASDPGRLVAPGSGEADIFIYPGFTFKVVGALLTNFHLPQSSLLMLASAFAGRDFVLSAYHHAVAQRYRFFSYGDCMFIE
jgi:S-adenosylmethionine:tRNA ribosyltransferase-isomerase